MFHVPGIDFKAVVSACYFSTKIEQELLDFCGRTITKPQRTIRRKNIVGQKTMEARLYGITSSIKTLIEIGFSIKTLQNVGAKHIEALHSVWTEEGGKHALSPARVHNLNCFLRLLFEVHLGKRGLVKHVAEYSSDCKRTYVAERDKSWIGNDIDAHALIAKIESDGPLGVIVARQLELCYAFGLRVEESWLARPVELLNQALDKEQLRIEHGTKGGRARDVPLTDLTQLGVLMRAAPFAKHDKSSMVPTTHTLGQWDATFYRVLRKHGVMRKTTNGGLGVTAHGLRHQYAHGLYKKLTGQEPPIRSVNEIDVELHRASLRTLIESLGHSDTRKAGAYLSTPTVMRRLRRLAAQLVEPEPIAIASAHGAHLVASAVPAPAAPHISKECK